MVDGKMDPKTSLSADEIAHYRQSFQQRTESRFAAREKQREQAKQAANDAITAVMPNLPNGATSLPVWISSSAGVIQK